MAKESKPSFVLVTRKWLKTNQEVIKMITDLVRTIVALLMMYHQFAQ